MLCEKCKKIVTREVNALGDQIKIMIETLEKNTEFANDFSEGKIKGCTEGMKDMQDNLSRMVDILGL